VKETDLYIPDGLSESEAQERVTHMGIGAHQDDLEIFAYHGVETCYESSENFFAGVTVTDGGGSSRVGPYADYSDEQMKQIRLEEQNKAADLGKYALQMQLGNSSAQVKDTEGRRRVIEELTTILKSCRPKALYLHNPADKHDTHIAVLACCLEALRRLDDEELPEEIYGCEVWRDLDWLDDSAKVMLPVDRYPELARELIAVFKSQVAGGKDYVSATLGRRLANATYFDSHSSDQAKAYTVAVNLRPLLVDRNLSLESFMNAHLARFKRDVAERIQKYDSNR